MDQQAGGKVTTRPPKNRGTLRRLERAAGGAPNEDAFNCQMEGKPCDRWCGANPCLAEHESEYAAELTQTTTPTNEVPSGPASAAPEPKEAYCIDYAQGRARGRTEGLEAAAKIACKACLDEFCKFEELLPESFTLNQMEEMVEASIQIAIRAKIKPGSGKGEV